MNGKYLLDTMIIIALFKNDQGVQTELAKSAEVFVPAIGLGELFYGAVHSGDPERHLNQVREFSAQSSILNCDNATAQFYGQIKHGLKIKGRPIPENDVWIASIARQHGLTVATRDQHFSEVEGLSVAKW